MSIQKLAILLVSAALIAGCAKKPKPDDETGDRELRDDRFTTQPLPDEGQGEGRAAGRAEGDFGAGETPEELLGRTIVYFDFDSAAIRAEYSQMLAAHAAHLSERGRVNIRLEGHTDERGSREYNIGLGERRSQAVRRALMLQGVGAGQISTVSYGEERPAVTGNDEEAWAMNRRVEIVYLK